MTTSCFAVQTYPGLEAFVVRKIGERRKEERAYYPERRFAVNGKRAPRFDAFLPMLVVNRSGDPGRWGVVHLDRSVLCPLFPSYLFVFREGFTGDDWHAICDTRGVVNILGEGGPRELRGTDRIVVDELRASGGVIIADAPPAPPFEPGQRLRVTVAAGGPNEAWWEPQSAIAQFAGKVGICRWSNPSITKVQLWIMGGERDTTLPTACLESAA